MKRIVFFYLLILTVFFACQNESNQDTVKNEKIEIDSTIYYDSIWADLRFTIDTFFRNKQKNKEFNGTVLIAERGRIIHQGAYGYTNPKNTDTLSINHKFQLASLSKPFTAVAIMMLKEKNLLNLQDTLGKFFPDFPFRGITVEMLLCHRGGLGNYNYFVEEYWPDKNRAISNDSVLSIIFKHKPKTYYLPDTKFDYSNTGYFLLASIVERVSGEKFETFLKQNIFDSLGMKNTFVYNKCLPVSDSMMLSGYDWKDRLITDFYQNGVVGDKGIFSTVGDLFLFDQAIYQSRLLKSETWQLMFEPRIPEREKPESNNYGYGWRLKTSFKGYEVVYHAGWWKGFRSLLIRNLSLKQTIIFLDNMKRNSFMSVEELLDLADGGIYSTLESEDSLYKSE